MFKNVASQKVRVFAFDSTTNLPKTGDAANISAYISKDFGAVTQLTDTSATEEDATNAKGYYLFDITQTETNADSINVTAKSTTGNIVVLGVPAHIYTTPPNFTALAVTGGGVTLADTVSHGGTLGSSTATLALKQVNVTNSAGDAVVASSTGSNGVGLKVSGNGTGQGLKSTGGATANGAEFVGGATSGDGFVVGASTSGNGFSATGVGTTKHGIVGIGGSTSSDGIRGVGGGTGYGIDGVGGTTGGGIRGIGGATSGAGITGSTQAGNSTGILASGSGSGHGISAAGGSTGDGITATTTAGAQIRGTITGGVTGTLGDLDTATVGTYTIRQLLRGLASALLGKLTGGGTTTNTIRSADDTKNVIVATVDASGNRSAITLDLT